MISSLALATDAATLLERAVVGARGKSEVCGLLGGLLLEPRLALATVVYPLTNLSLLNTSFAIDPEDFLEQRRCIEKAGLVAVALYHSHPGSSAEPTLRDLDLPGITGLPSLIVAVDSGAMKWTCYDDHDGDIVPIPVIAFSGLGEHLDEEDSAVDALGQ